MARSKISTIGFALFMLMGPLHAMSEVAVIGHPSVGVSSLSADQAAKIFLGKTKVLPDSSPVAVVDQKEGSSARDEFYSKIVKKNNNQMKAYWAKIMFTGKGSPPRALASDSAVKSWVSSTPGGVGYIDASAVDSSVKVLLRQK